MTLPATPRDAEPSGTPATPPNPLAGIVVGIPSFHPSEALLETVRAVQAVGLHEVVVVDDGSGTEFGSLFDEVEELPGVVVLRHPENLGKGTALKTLFAHCQAREDVRGVVTADADGQHLAEDVLKVAISLAGHLVERDSDVAVLGVRDFTLPDLPTRSRLGNRLTTGVVRLLYGQDIPDTQTGLRGFSHGLLDTLLEVRGARFEYEMNALSHLLTYHVRLFQVPIETVYHDHENSQSHFRPVRDSVMIYRGIIRQFVKFVGASLLGALVDVAVFTLVIDAFYDGRAALGAVGGAALVARLVSSLVNYGLNRQAVFEIRRPVGHSLPRYVVLAVGVFLLSALLTSGLGTLWDGHVVRAKIVVDTLLFFLSYLLQKRWVFTPSRHADPT
ncbi:bifunctional glycosyltransferase family 2/GtrA family protein [Arthrobacter sp. NEB 688]|uniref:bifunctional glycosyltransferase family 2/GtrA family protein n=1 Tax=Arthrobacter sp. NEB 688 TaxID=904039 RepID=UPI001563075E|nr:bifunctional glycosyltransferase family 2/GtrA family protein [Arthrobacter sp. NEB 688]QKE83173.1 bifunctional glycosyltransferase family 2/GtrA family protein [Arthrobacter sp. NEB 688]